MREGDRVRVISAPDGEQELIGMEGVIIKWKWGKPRVLLDDDKFSTDFYEKELEVIE